MYLKLEIITHQWKNPVLLLEGTWGFLLALFDLIDMESSVLLVTKLSLRDW